MRNLFCINLSSIDEGCLKSFSQDRVQWFEEHVEIVWSGEEARDHKFESFNRVFSLSSCIHEVRERGAAGDRVVEGRFGVAGSDRKRYLGEVELPRENLPADDFDHLLPD